MATAGLAKWGHSVKPEKLLLQRQSIETAFDECVYPGDDAIVGWTTRPLVGGGEGEDYEVTEIRDAFAGKDWKTLDPDFLVCHYTAPTFLTAQALQYYLPAYLWAALEHRAVRSSIATRLTPACSDPQYFRLQEEQWRLLTSTQRRCIAAFFEYYLTDEDEGVPTGISARTALDYWSGTEYVALLCRQDPIAEAAVTLLQPEHKGRLLPVFPGYRPILHRPGFEGIEVRLDFDTKSESFKEPGETFLVSIAVATASEASDELLPGTKFELWEPDRRIGAGTVIRRL
jgi:hypothetical protein